ncbi:MAG: S8 family peptidase [Chitinophagales bacterium]|nr:S8 family peptidase [Chitinophagales bacterium]
MTKTFTLLMLFIGNVFLSYSKSGFQLVEINPANFDNSTSRVNTENFRFGNKDYIVIQPKINSAAYLSENGIDVQAYLGDGYYLTAMDAVDTKKKLQSVQLSKVGYISEESKLDETLRSISSFEPVSILYASATNSNTLTELAQKTGISIIYNDVKNHHFSTYANASQLKQLTQYPFVYFVTKYYPVKNPLIYDGSIMLGANQVQELQPYGFNLKGDGINVGIWDDGAVGTHIDLPVNKNFVVEKERSGLAYMFHPTEVAGCIGGSGNVFAQLKGIAPHCNMYYWDILNDIVKEIADGKSKYDIDITNHSYNFSPTNCFQSGLYIPEAADLDKVVYNNPTLLPVVAVGNTATANCAVATDTFNSIDIGFQGCKNALTVGWLFTTDKIVENSGRGPTVDGRIKPELVAKGFAVSVLTPNNNFSLSYGSSYAAPQVSGLAALLYQKYKQQFGIIPNASLVKAILINTARDLGNKGPDYIYGYGKPDAYRAVATLANNYYFEDIVIQNEFKTRIISVPPNSNQLKITLSWTDKEGSPISIQSIVNNLDLKLVTPSGDTVLPWKLNPSSPGNIALKGIDNVNTNEQITIDNPLSGQYKIVVKGSSVPFGPQNYSVSYFSQDRKLEITYPNGGEMLYPTLATKIKWYSNGIDSTSVIEFSSDSGATWQILSANNQLSKQTFDWTVPNVASKNCFLKISSGNNIAVSAATFSIGSQINYNLINHSVCDKSVKLNWSAFSGASAYRVYLFADSVWTFVEQTTQLSTTINNLINGKLYFYSVSTINNGVESDHSSAKSFIPLANACTSLNDVGVYAIHQPWGGRKFTSALLGATEKLSFIIKNYGTNTQNSVSVSYIINGGLTRTATLTDVITSNDTSIIRFTVNENLSATGIYNVVAWTNLPADNNSGNDTLYYTIKHLQNAPLILPFSESFENVKTQLSEATFGIVGNDYIDYNPEYGGRIRTNLGDLYANTGKRALTVDNFLGGVSAKKNEILLTYNLSNYIDSLVFLDFSFINHSEADSNDLIYARGNDTKPWVRIYDLYANRNTPGKYNNVKEINLYQKLKIEQNQDFSSSTQLKIEQSGTKSVNNPFTDGGYSFDDFKLYNAGRDVAIIDASLKKVNCSKTYTPQPVSIKIVNNSSQSILNLPVFYKVGNNDAVNEFVPFTINPNDTVVYNFNTLFDNNSPGFFAVLTWIENAGDRNNLNDTFKTSVIVLKTVDSFPYYNDFELNNGNVFTEGTNNSWVWGTPLKYNISNAAQETKAWTTGINTGYNFNEDSYLYLGCLDFSGLTADPYISFNFVSVMQSQSDSAYAEYSADGILWKRLGCFGCGLNWYNGFQGKPYWDRVVYPWQVAHLKVPLASLDDSSSFIFRIHLLSDDFVVSEGIGIDDIRIFNNPDVIATTDSAYVSQVSSGNGWIQFYRNGRLVAELNDDNRNLGAVSVGYESNSDKQKVLNDKNILSRNWVFKPQNAPIGNYKIRLYILNSEYTNFVLDEDSINRMGDIGLLRYVGLNTNLDIIDNHVKSYYKYFSPSEIQFYPYQNGYFVEFNTDTLGEFYLISLKSDADAIQSINLLDFAAQKNNDDVYLSWKTTREVNSKQFIIQYSFDASTFIDVDTVPAGGFSSNTTLYNYLHELNANSGIYYYRIKMVDNTNKFTFSLIDSVYFTPSVGIKQNSVLANAYISGQDIVIEFKNKLQTPSTVLVYNSLGQLQFSKKMSLVNGINPLGISNFQNWSKGAYYLQIQAGEHSYYSKLMKQ